MGTTQQETERQLAFIAETEAELREARYSVIDVDNALAEYTRQIIYIATDNITDTGDLIAFIGALEERFLSAGYWIKD